MRLRRSIPCRRQTTRPTRCRSLSSLTRAIASTCAISHSPGPTKSTTRCCDGSCASSQTDQYVTTDGLSRTVNLAYTDQSQLTSSFSSFSSTSYQAGLDFSYPITEWQAVRFGLSGQHAEYLAPSSTSQQIQDWVRLNGNSSFRAAGTGAVWDTTADMAELTAGWSFDSRNR